MHILHREALNQLLFTYPAAIDNLMEAMMQYSEWRLLQRELLKAAEKNRGERAAENQAAAGAGAGDGGAAPADV